MQTWDIRDGEEAFPDPPEAGDDHGLLKRNPWPPSGSLIWGERDRCLCSMEYCGTLYEYLQVIQGNLSPFYFDSSQHNVQILLGQEMGEVQEVLPMTEEEVTEDVILSASIKIKQIYSKAENNKVTLPYSKEHDKFTLIAGSDQHNQEIQTGQA